MNNRRFTARDAIEAYGVKRALEEHLPLGYVLYRRPSFYLTAPFLNAGLSPSAVTALGVVVGCLGVALLAVPLACPQIAGFALLYVAMLLDYVDGNMARCLKRTSHFGKFVDGCASIIIHSPLPVALGVAVAASGDGCWLPGGGVSWVVVGAAKAVCFLLTNYVQVRSRAAHYELADQVARGVRAAAARELDAASPQKPDEEPVRQATARESLYQIAHRWSFEAEFPALLPGILFGLSWYLLFFTLLELINCAYTLVTVTVGARRTLGFWRPY